MLNNSPTVTSWCMHASIRILGSRKTRHTRHGTWLYTRSQTNIFSQVQELCSDLLTSLGSVYPICPGPRYANISNRWPWDYCVFQGRTWHIGTFIPSLDCHPTFRVAGRNVWYPGTHMDVSEQTRSMRLYQSIIINMLYVPVVSNTCGSPICCTPGNVQLSACIL